MTDVTDLVPSTSLTPAGEADRHALAQRQEQESTTVSEATARGELDRVRNVAIYLPINLLDRLKRTRRSRDLTYAELLVEAAAAHLDSLENTFGSGAAPTSGTGMPSRERRRLPEPGVQVQIRLDGHQLHWLDTQIKRLDAPSRTALVAALFEAHLT